jgi:hypothetical protein
VLSARTFCTLAREFSSSRRQERHGRLRRILNTVLAAYGDDRPSRFSRAVSCRRAGQRALMVGMRSTLPDQAAASIEGHVPVVWPAAARTSMIFAGRDIGEAQYCAFIMSARG